MSTTPPDPRVEMIINLVAEAADGATIADLEPKLTPRVPHRTLQLWLADLVKEGRLKVRGANRSTRYVLPRNRVPLAPAPAPQPASRVMPAPAPIPSQPPPPRPHLPPSPPVPAPEPRAIPAASEYGSRVDPRFPPLFRRIFPRLIKSGLNKSSAEEHLVLEGVRAFHDDSLTIRIFAAQGVLELDALTEADMPRFGVSSADFEFWQRYWK